MDPITKTKKGPVQPVHHHEEVARRIFDADLGNVVLRLQNVADVDEASSRSASMQGLKRHIRKP